MPLVRYTLLLVVSSLAALMAAPHRVGVYPNPSIAILSIAEDPSGFLWLAATDGLYRFDGFRYEKVGRYPFASARLLALTPDGTLWIGSEQGLARYKGDFHVVSRDSIVGLVALQNRVLVKAGVEQRSVTLTGITSRSPVDGRDYLTKDAGGALWATSKWRRAGVLLDPDRLEKPVRELPLPDGFEQVARDSQGRLWAADDTRAVLVVNGQQAHVFTRRHSQRTTRAYPLQPGRDGRLWFIGDTIRELGSSLEFNDRAADTAFQPTAACEDSRGHLWVARLGYGLTKWTREPAWHRWSSDHFGGQPAAQVMATNARSIVAATRTNLYRLDAARDVWLPIGAQSRTYAAALPLASGFLASVRRFGFARLSATAEILERPPNPLRTSDEYRIIRCNATGQCWVANKIALMRIAREQGALRLVPELLPEVADGQNAQAVDLEIDGAGHPWVAYAKGVAWRDDSGRWHKLSTSEQLLHLRSLTLADNSGEDIWVAYRGNGRYSRLRKAGSVWQVEHFTVRAGYGPDETHFIKRDSRGWIWRGAPDGVHVSDGVHFRPHEWLHIGLRNGLATDPTDQYGFFEDRDGTVWISGEDGVSHINPDPSWFRAPQFVPPPGVTRIETHGPGSVRVAVGSLYSPPFRDYPFRYRLQPLSADWQVSRDGMLQFDNLEPGTYTLEVTYTGEGVAPVLTHSFAAPPAGPQTNWLWLFPFPLAAGVLALFLPWFPWSEKNRYIIAKHLFLLRRRFLHSPSDSSDDRPVTEAAHALNGAIFRNRYQLIRVVSHGGFSIVYEARDVTQHGVRVAIKILRTTPATEGWLRDRFAHEIAAVRSVEHPAVIRVIDSWVSPEGEPCLAMPFLDGSTLRQRMNAGRMPLPQVAKAIRHIGSALACLHEKGIVHRDLKPENIMFSDEQPVLIDFGTAGLRGRQEELSTTTLLAGSFHYMAPERLTGHYSPASDVYSLGVIVLEMLTGKRLDDLPTVFAEEAFADELRRLIESVVPANGIAAFVHDLAKTYDPKPRNRPQDVQVWSQRLAESLEPACQTMRSAIQRAPKS